jgi:hypothetical protein
VQKIVSWVLVGLGTFLLVAAIVAQTWAPDQVKRTPLDTNSVTGLTGVATVLPTDTGTFDVKAVSITRADSEASDEDVVVFENHSCLVLDRPGVPQCGEQGTGENADPNVVSISSDFFATDRRTGVATNEEGYLPQGTPPHEGLINKFPFDTETRDYAFWDGILDDTVTAAYQGSEEIDGLETYRFNYVVDNVPAEVSAGIDGTYSMDKTMWIEPTTGAIIDQTQAEVRQVDGTPVLDIELSFTDEQVATNVSTAKENKGSIDLITGTVPLVGFIAGPILIVLGLVLLARQRRRGGEVTEDRAEPEPVTAGRR